MSQSNPIRISHQLLERIRYIDQQLQENRFPNCRTVAEALEVSEKTAQREFEFMRDRLHRPIAYDRPRHGYYYSEPVADLPTVKISEGEVFSLLIAQKALEQYRGTPFESVLKETFEKITSQLRDEISFNPSEVMSGFSFRSFGTSKADIKTFEVMARAVRLSREVTITYQKPGEDQPQTRRIRPYHLANIQNLWYAISLDPEKADNELRKFALPRIKAVRLEETKFQRPASFSAEKYLKKSFGAFGGTEDIEVKIRFDAFAARFVEERSWHPTEKFTKKSGGELELTMHVPRLEEVQSWVLSWGEHAKVMQPKILAELVRKAGRAIARRYG